ncbi:MAG: hypothetical protein CL861_07330 [Cyanobium sp. MED843]|nr:hypothetical protein [Cyanobium sp. MED843]
MGELPLFQAWSVNLRRLMTKQRVLVVVSDQRLVCSWRSRLGWVWRSATWPEACCRDGQPLQPEAMGELLADLLLDADLVGTQVELVLPIEGCEWRVLDGVDVHNQAMADPTLAWLDHPNWPLVPTNSYATLTTCGADVMAIGVPSVVMQAWIDVVELADQPLRRVDWTLSSALRGLMLQLEDWLGDLAWLFPAQQGLRLVLIRDGVPEVDHTIQLAEPDVMRQELRRIVSAWQSLTSSSPCLGWCLSLPEHLVAMVLPVVDIDRDEQRLDLSLEELVVPSPETLQEEELTPLEQLALIGMLEDVYP